VQGERLAARCAVLALAGLVALIVPSLAAAGTVQLAASEVTFTAAAGEANHLVVSREASGVRLVDTGAALTAGPGCTPVGANEALCSVGQSTFVDITIRAADMNDFVSAVSVGFPNYVRVYGGDGGDVLEVDADCDFCPFRSFGNRLRGGPGTDTLQGGGNGINLLDGGLDADVISGGQRYDLLDYSSHTNPVTVDFDGDDGEAGEGDVVGGGIDGVRGGAGNDILMTGGSQVQDIFGGPGNDKLIARHSPFLGGSLLLAEGGPGDDQLVGGPFGDLFEGGSGADIVRGGGERDSLRGGSGADIVRGGEGNDSLSGGRGTDLLIGGDGPDRLDGRHGADVLRSRDGARDVVHGGSGSDRARIDGLDVVRGVEAFF
jgi:Ca2+-binding RTX toxin-like protein